MNIPFDVYGKKDNLQAKCILKFLCSYSPTILKPKS